MQRLKKWELALICAVAVTLLLGATPGDAWWGAVYPELTPPGGVQTVSTARAGEGVVLRLRSLEWLGDALHALGVR